MSNVVDIAIFNGLHFPTGVEDGGGLQMGLVQYGQTVLLEVQQRNPKSWVLHAVSWILVIQNPWFRGEKRSVARGCVHLWMSPHLCMGWYPPPPLYDSKTKVPRFDQNNTYCCSDKGLFMCPARSKGENCLVDVLVIR